MAANVTHPLPVGALSLITCSSNSVLLLPDPGKIMSQGSYFAQAVSTENHMYTALVKITYFSTTKVHEFQMNKFVQYLLWHFLLNAECISHKKTIRPAILNLYNQYNNTSIFLLTFLRRASFWPQFMVYISVIFTHITNYIFFIM